MIRPPRLDELPLLREVERAAGDTFRDVGMDAVADDEPPSLDVLAAHVAGRRCWVVTDDTDLPVGYVLVDLVDDAAHIEQVSVHPRAARRGLGRGLVEVVAEWAKGRRLTAVTLTTFADVPWNAPYYERLGFHIIAPEELSEGLLRIRAEERRRGLDRWPRVAMRLPLAGSASS